MRVTCGVMLFFILVLPLALGAMCMLAVNSWLFNRDFYQSVLDDEQLYEALLVEMPQYLEFEDYQQLPEERRDASNRALALAFREVVTADYLRQEALGVVDDIFTLFESENYNLQIDVNLLPVKEALRGEEAADFARVLAAELPVCEAGQAPRASDEALISCRPEEVSVDDARQLIMTSLPRFEEEIPSQLILNEPVDAADMPTEEVVTIRSGFQAALWSIVFTAVIVWLITAFIAAASMRNRLFWLGLMLLAPAVFILLLGSGFSGNWLDTLTSQIYSADFTVNGVPAQPQTRAAYEQAVTTVFNRVGNGLTLVGVSAGLVGLILVMLGALSPRRDEDDIERKTVVIG